MSSKGQSSSSRHWDLVKTALSNQISRELLQPGDHIYTWRGPYIYAHHGIYIGEEVVIHFGNAGREIGTGTSFDSLFSVSSGSKTNEECENCKDQVDNLGVIKSCLRCFLSGGNLYRFEYSTTSAAFQVKLRGLCTMVPSDPPADVIHRAKQLLEKGFGTYNLFRKNCEDFAIYCKTSLLVESSEVFGNSSQVQSVKAAAFSFAEPLITGGLTWNSFLEATTNYLNGRHKNDIGSRAKKISIEELVSMR